MKKVLLITSFAFACSLVSKAADSSFTIKGKFDKVKSGLIYLYILGRDTKKDSSKIVNGKFSFKGFIQNPSSALLDLKDDKQSYFRFYLEPANIQSRHVRGIKFTRNLPTGTQIIGTKLVISNCEFYIQSLTFFEKHLSDEK